MRILRIGLPLGLFTILLLPPAQARKHGQVSAVFVNEYRGQLFTLRSFLSGSKLEFDSQGRPIGTAEFGPWTTCGVIQVHDIRMSGSELEIDAERVFLAYDPNRRRFVSLLKLEGELARWPSRQDKPLKALRELGRVSIKIHVSELSETGIRSAMRNVFLGRDELLEDAVPSYWRSFLRAARSRDPEGFLPLGVSRVEEGVSAPKAISAANPQYSAIAEKSDYRGALRVWLVVESDGTPGEIGIERPAGLGLDEKAIEAIRDWRFEPGTKEGKPVPVLVSVEVGFNQN